MTDSTGYSSFRQRLDTVLRTHDVEQVRAFLIGEGQWSLDQPADPEYAMWVMIAGAATLKDLHAEARQWLVQHDHAAEADAVLGRTQSGNQGKREDAQGKRKQGRKNGYGTH